MSRFQAWINQIAPPTAGASPLEQLRFSVAALLALGLTGALSLALLGPAGVWLIAPMGASAVLLFCLPASPLAQPWSVIGGNTVSALVGVACARLGLEPVLAAPLAGGCAIGAMFAMRCLHPPGGAVALTAVLAGPAVHALGFGFALVPVALNSALMVGAALLVNNLTGRRYPHRAHAAMSKAPDSASGTGGAQLGFRSEDLDAVLQRYGQVLDVNRDDLADIIMATETEAYQRRFGVVTCGSIMSKGGATLEFGDSLGEAWRLMRGEQVQALPVLNRARRVIGIVTQGDFLRHSDGLPQPQLGARLRGLLQKIAQTHSDKPEVVGQIMTARVNTVRPATPMVDLVAMMADAGVHQIPVVDHENRYVGIVTQTDMVAALYQGRLAELASA